MRVLTYGIQDTFKAEQFDLDASYDGSIPVGGAKRVVLNICMKIPEGYEGQIRSNSALVEEFGIVVLGPTFIRGLNEVKLIMFNHGDRPFDYGKGLTLAHLTIAPIIEVEYVRGTRDAVMRGR